MPVEQVVLVNDADEVVGTAPKATVHGARTPLHRGFSLFAFNRRGELLLQQRARHKLTWPGVWSNTCCGHPRPGESYVDATVRRAQEELGLKLADIFQAAPYRYRFQHNGVEEHEICPILVGVTDHQPQPNPAEVAATRWVDWRTLLAAIRQQPGQYSEWCEEQIAVLDRTPAFNQWYSHLSAGRR